MVLTIIAGLLMGFAHYFSEVFCAKCKPYYTHIVSFTAGVGVTYVFLDLFPKFSEIAVGISRFLFLSVLVGFGAFHLVEKYIYQHNRGKKLAKTCTQEEFSVSFVYHLLVGIVLVGLFNESRVEGFLFFVPMFLFTIASALPIPPPKHQTYRVVLASSTLIGVIISKFLWDSMNPFIQYSLLGLVLGIISFWVIRHAIPSGKEGKPASFFLGSALYTLVIISTWVFG